MRLESALYSSREGLQAHGQGISVIGDNVANSNTVGFKRSRIEFADLFSDGPSQKSSPPTDGGGSGVRAAQVRQIYTPGAIEATGRATDVAIDGNGFFIIGETTAPTYSRAGNFAINSAGLLVNAEGQTVLGYQGNETTTLSTINMASVPNVGRATQNLTVYGNLDARSEIKTAPVAPTSFADLQRQATYTTVADVYDSLGTSRSVTLAFTRTGTSEWSAQAYVDGASVTGGTAGVPTLLGTTTLPFGGDGTVPDASQAAATIAATPAWTGGATAGAININLGQWTQYSAGSIPASITQDGQGIGNISSYRFDRDGRIFASLDSGGEALIGRIALADVPNRDALNRNGNLALSPGDGAGDVTIGGPNSGNFGKIVGGSLERSTVDIANEFIDLVVMQRGYQANSQTFSTAAQLLRDTIGLIR